MAVNQEIIKCERGQWTQLTNADADTITFQAQDNSFLIRITEDATPPVHSGRNAGIRYEMDVNKNGELKRPLTELSNLSAPKRVWATPVKDSVAEIFVDHADAV